MQTNLVMKPLLILRLSFNAVFTHQFLSFLLAKLDLGGS
jgi:hypothetical protein